MDTPATTPAGTPVERSFLVVVDWPAVMDHAARSAAIEYALGEPRAMCDSLARRETPSILTVGPREKMREAARALRRAGVPAMYPSRADMGDVMPPFRTRRLVRAEGASAPLYMCEPWGKRQEGRGINLLDVRLIVKARIKRFQVESVFENQGATIVGMRTPVTEFDALMFEGWASATQTMGLLGDVLDLWTDEGTAVRIDGRRFDFSMLGNRKGFSDAENMTTLATLLGEQATNARIDLDFKQFAAPPATVISQVVGGGGVTIRREDEGPAFDVYSALLAIVERALRKARGGSAG